MIGKNATIICVGGWKYQGDVVDVQINPFASAQFFKIETKNGFVIVNSRHVVSILYAKN